MSSKKLVSDSLRMFRQSVKAVLPDELIRRNVEYNHSLHRLSISGETINLKDKRVHIVGAGKAVQYMAREMERILGPAITSGVISIPHGSLESRPRTNVQYYEGAKNNLPDECAVQTSVKIKNLVSALNGDDILIVVISGGGSALLTLPQLPITLQEKVSLIKNLANAGADIVELNTVRKKLSQLKGGRLVTLAHPAQVVGLVLSDIVGDPLDLIASGPTVTNMDPSFKAKDITDKYHLFDGLPTSIQKVLLLDEVHVDLHNIKNYIIGSNRLSLDAALKEAIALKYHSVVVSSEIVGSVPDVAKDYISLIKCLADLHYNRISNSEAEDILKSLNLAFSKDFITNIQGIIGERMVCLLFGGETTIEVHGGGKGGRNQHLALELSKQLHDSAGSLYGVDVCVTCAGTDGMDGPTDAAGAVGYSRLLEDARRENLNTEQYLTDNDSYTFYSMFRAGQLHVKTGHTNTNVMDIHIIILSFD